MAAHHGHLHHVCRGDGKVEYVFQSAPIKHECIARKQMVRNGLVHVMNNRRTLVFRGVDGIHLERAEMAEQIVRIASLENSLGVRGRKRKRKSRENSLDLLSSDVKLLMTE